MPEDDRGSGSGDAKVWVSSQLPERIIEFCYRLEKESDKVDPLEIELFISQTWVGEAETDAWLRYIADLRTRPNSTYTERAADGKLHRYRIDWTFSNPAVRDAFYKTLFNELRKKALKMDAISQLGYAIGSWRRGDNAQVRFRKPQGWHL